MVSQDLRFVSSEDQAAFEDEEAEEDVLALELVLDVQALIEDELIMAMPVVPMHSDCQPEGWQASEPLIEDKPNPFAGLATLKKVQWIKTAVVAKRRACDVLIPAPIRQAHPVRGVRVRL